MKPDPAETTGMTEQSGLPSLPPSRAEGRVAWHPQAETRLEQAVAVFRANLLTRSEHEALAEGIPMVHGVHVDAASASLRPRRAPRWLSAMAGAAGVVFGVTSGGVVNLLTTDAEVGGTQLAWWLVPAAVSLALGVFAYTSKARY